MAPDVGLGSDGGGKVSAARRPVHGADRVARFLAGLLRQAPPDLPAEVAGVNAVRNPDELSHLAGVPGRPDHGREPLGSA